MNYPSIADMATRRPVFSVTDLICYCYNNHNFSNRNRPVSSYRSSRESIACCATLETLQSAHTDAALQHGTAAVVPKSLATEDVTHRCQNHCSGSTSGLIDFPFGTSRYLSIRPLRSRMYLKKKSHIFTVGCHHLMTRQQSLLFSTVVTDRLS